MLAAEPSLWALHHVRGICSSGRRQSHLNASGSRQTIRSRPAASSRDASLTTPLGSSDPVTTIPSG